MINLIQLSFQSDSKALLTLGFFVDVMSCKFRFVDLCLLILELLDDKVSRGSKTNSASLDIPPLENVALSEKEAGEIWFNRSSPC